ncbi:MAG TPA: AsmA-like C-terminal domain-containing protein [Stellaceae bacterium]|nr:AsmA-like C-terminal domain-containing protein [Stellaceae bacterium]
MTHRKAARHVGRGAHHLLRWFASFAAVMSLIALFGTWRLMQGPIQLDWLAPYVEAGLDRSGIGLKVTISGVRFGLDRGTHQLDLRAENVHVSLPDGEPLASFPEMATSFALSALLRGRFEPTQVVVERPVLHLVRDAGGSISARIGAGDQPAPDLGPQMLEHLAGPREREAPLGLLRELRIRGATVVVEDRRSGRTWRADRVDLAVERSAKGVRGNFSLAMPMGGNMPEARAFYRYFADRQVLDLDLEIEGVHPADIPPLIPELAQLQHLEAAVSGTLRTRIDLAQRKALGSRLDLALGKGRVHSEWLPTGSTAVERGALHAVYAPENSEVRLEELALDLGGGTRLVLNGTLGGITPELIAAPADARPQGHVVGQLNAALKHVPVARLGELWPKQLSADGRRWVLANLHDGILDEATAQFGLDLDPVAHTATLLNARGSLRYHDLTIDYFKGLPMAYQVGGTATFAGNHLDFTPTSGMLKGMKVTGGAVRLTELDAPIESVTIDLTLVGPLQDALEVIDSKPLYYARAVGIEPARVGGRAETQLHFKLPLINALKFDDVEYGARATITGANLGKIVLDRAVTDGSFALDVARTGAHVQGTARFDGTPAKLDAKVFFHPKSGPRSTYRVALTLDDEAQRRLDLDFLPDRLKGPIAADITYSVLAGNRGEATALLDLRGAALSIAEAGWSKPPDRPGTAKVVLDIENEAIIRIPQIDIKAEGLDGRFTAQLGADRKHVDRVEIRRLLVGQTDVTGTVTRRPAGGWFADIHAARADARHLLKEAASGTPSVPSQPLTVNARVDQLILGTQRELRQVTANLARTGGVWQSGRLEGRYVNGHRLSLHFDEGGGHRLTFQSDDLGATLQALDIADGVVGGQVTVDGQISDVGGKRTLRAHVEGKNYTLVRAPLLTRILALPSLTGFASMLSGSGLPFMTLRGDFAYGGGRLTVERMLAFGEALGVTAEGWADVERDRLELRGTVAPAYALNSILDIVPVIGQLLGGGSEGLFAANFRLSGASADPQVTVNPLSALAPGVLRQLFAPIVGVSAPQQEQRAAQ